MDKAGLTYRQVDYWCRTAVLVVEGDGGPTPGSGYNREFSWREARVACALGQLRVVGVDLVNLRRVAAQLRLIEDDAWAGVVYVTPDGWLSAEPPSLGWRIDLGALPEFEPEPAAV